MGHGFKVTYSNSKTNCPNFLMAPLIHAHAKLSIRFDTPVRFLNFGFAANQAFPISNISVRCPASDSPKPGSGHFFAVGMHEIRAE